MSIAPLDNEKVDGEAFFITNDSPTYFWDFAHLVYREAGATLGVDPSTRWTLGSDLSITIATIGEWVMWPFGKTPNMTRSRVRYATLTKYHSINKAKERLGYAPIVSLEDGVKRGVKEVLKREYGVN